MEEQNQKNTPLQEEYSSWPEGNKEDISVLFSVKTIIIARVNLYLLKDVLTIRELDKYRRGIREFKRILVENIVKRESYFIIKMLTLPLKLVFNIMAGKEEAGVLIVKKEFILIMTYSRIFKLITNVLGVKREEDYPKGWVKVRNSSLFKLTFSLVGVISYSIMKTIFSKGLEGDSLIYYISKIKGDKGLLMIFGVIITLLMLLRVIDNIVLMVETIRRTNRERETGLYNARLRKVLTLKIIKLVFLMLGLYSIFIKLGDYVNPEGIHWRGYQYFRIRRRK